MEQMRLLLAIVLSFLVFIVWQWLFVEPEMAKQAQEQATLAEKTVTPEEKGADQSNGAQDAALEAAEPAPAVVPPPTDDGREPRTIKVETPLYNITLSEKGATVESLTLTQYRETADTDSLLKTMIDERARLINLAYGLSGKSVAGLDGAVYVLQQPSDMVTVTDQKATIEFRWANNDGVSVTKQFSFLPDSYLI